MRRPAFPPRLTPSTLECLLVFGVLRILEHKRVHKGLSLVFGALWVIVGHRPSELQNGLAPAYSFFFQKAGVVAESRQPKNGVKSELHQTPKRVAKTTHF
jgi:hypothetical protein